MSRQDIPNIEDRRPFYLYVDEFQNFATDLFATILSEARKYGLNLYRCKPVHQPNERKRARRRIWQRGHHDLFPRVRRRRADFKQTVRAEFRSARFIANAQP